LDGLQKQTGAGLKPVRFFKRQNYSNMRRATITLSKKSALW